MKPSQPPPVQRPPVRRPLVIGADVDALLLCAHGSVRLGFGVQFLYDTSDPYALQLGFPTLDPRRPATTWTPARNLLDEGQRILAGEGDVRVGPHDADRVRLRLSRADHTADILLERAGLRRFVDDTYRVVPAGHEHHLLDLDAGLAELLAEAG